MSNSDLIRKYFSADENKDRKVVESLLSNDFVFSSPYNYRIDRETYFKRCWPYSEQSPTYGIEKMLERDNEAFIHQIALATALGKSVPTHREAALGTMRNPCQGTKHERIRIPAYLPMMAVPVNERGCNG